jgi:hypothetical protein
MLKAAVDSGLPVEFYTYLSHVVGGPTATGTAGENRLNTVVEFTPNVPVAASTTHACDTRIDPSHVQTASAGEYHIRVDFGPVRMRRSWSCFWTAAFRRSAESKSIQAPTVIDVPRDSLKLSRAFLDQFAAETPEEAKATGKIFGSQNLPAFLAGDSTQIPIQIPHAVVVRYPSGPAFAFFGGLLALVALAVVALRSIDPSSLWEQPVVAETALGERLPARWRRDAIYVREAFVGRVAGERFTPAGGTRLTSGEETASIAAPVQCVLDDDTPVVLRFGRRPTVQTPKDTASRENIELERR